MVTFHKFSQRHNRNRNQSIMKSLFSVLQHFEKGVVLHLKKAWTLFTQECFCAKFGRNQFYSPVEEEDFKFCQCFFAISLFFPLRKKHGPTFQQPGFPFTLGCYVPSLVEIGTVVLEKIFKFCQCIFAISVVSLFISANFIPFT